jgi:large subunit ribosomal protein L30
MADLKITLVRSPIGRKPKHRLTVQALGLRKLGASVVQKDNPAIRGMIHQIGYLLKVEANPGEAGDALASGRPASSAKQNERKVKA